MTNTWTNWSGSVTCQPQNRSHPTTETDIIALVRTANAAGQKLRVAGTGHSFVPLCASEGVLLSLDGLQGLVSTDSTDPDALQATVWGGSKIWQLGDPLLAADMGMANIGDIDRQSIAGAISTGTHGTGRTLGNIATQVVGLRLILASGEIVDCTAEQEPDLFKAARVSLGVLGIISQVRLQLQAAYRLHEQTQVLPFQACFDQLDHFIETNRHFEFFWWPPEDDCAMKMLNPTEAPRHIPETTTPEAGGLDRYLKPDRIDYSHRIFPSERNRKFNEMEFALPAENGPDCLLEIRDLMRQKFPEVTWPLEYRTVAADAIDLSPHHGRASVTISIHQAHDLPHEAFFAAAEAIFRNHRGRPHWGKLHSHSAADLRDLYPQWDHFQTIRRQVDPEGRFMNDYLEGLLGTEG